MGPGSVKLLERMREEPDGGASPPSKSATGEVELEGGPGVVGLGPNKLKMSPFWPRWWADTVCVGVIGGVAGGYSAASKLLKRDLGKFFDPLSCLTGPKIYFGYPCRKKGDVKRGN